MSGLTVLVAALVISGCSSSKKEPSKSDNSAASVTTEEVETPSEATLPDEEFFRNVNNAKQAIADAGQDPCKLAESMSIGASTPANEEQTKALVELYEAMFTSAANILGTETTDGQAFAGLGKKMRLAAEVNDYSPRFMESKEFVELVSSDEFTKAGATFENMTSACDGMVDEAAPDDGQ